MPEQLNSMQKLSEGFKIFLEYVGEDGDTDYDHDVIYAGRIQPDNLKEGHAKKLEELGWFWNEEYECWQHF